MCAHSNNVYFKLLINHALVINDIHVSKTKNEIVLYKCNYFSININRLNLIIICMKLRNYVFLSDIVNHMQLLWLNFICYLHDAFIELLDRLTQ